MPDRREPSNPPAWFFEELQALGVAVPADAPPRLAAYVELLLETNRQFNLTGPGDTATAWRRHVLDSLTLLPALADLPSAAEVVDVGSGGGLPGVPLAIARPDLRFTLLEATGKKARFLERCVAEVPLPGTVVLHARAETVGRDQAHRGRYAAAVCRAVGPLREMLEYVLPLVAVGGRALAMKGARAEAELDAAGDALMLLGAGDVHLLEAYPEDRGMDAVIVSIVKARPTPREYPRPPGTPRHQPL